MTAWPRLSHLTRPPRRRPGLSALWRLQRHQGVHEIRLVTRWVNAGQTAPPAGRTDGPGPAVNPVIDMLQEDAAKWRAWQFWTIASATMAGFSRSWEKASPVIQSPWLGDKFHPAIVKRRNTLISTFSGGRRTPGLPLPLRSVDCSDRLLPLMGSLAPRGGHLEGRPFFGYPNQEILPFERGPNRPPIALTAVLAFPAPTNRRITSLGLPGGLEPLASPG